MSTHNWYSEVFLRNRGVKTRLRRNGLEDPVSAHLLSLATAAGGKVTLDAPEPKAPEFDGSRATARFLISSPSKDSYGDTVVPQGCMPHMARFNRNPVVLLSHNSRGFPVGSAYSENALPLVEVIPDTAVYSTVKFHLKTRESEDCCALVEARELRGASIGFMPKKGLRNKPPKGSEDDDSRPKNEVNFDPWMSFTFQEWELLEWTICAIPANPDCVAMRLAKGVGGRALSSGVREMLLPYAPAVRAWAPGWSGQPNLVGFLPNAAHTDTARTVKALVGHYAAAHRLLEKSLPQIDNERVKNYLSAEFDVVFDALESARELAAEVYPAMNVDEEPDDEVPEPDTELEPPVVPGGDVTVITADHTQLQLQLLLNELRAARASQERLAEELYSLTGRGA